MVKLFGFLVVAGALVFANDAKAFSTLRCRDAGGKSLFKGFVAENEGEQPGKFSHERTVTYSQAIASKAKTVIDRRSFSRLNGIELPKCQGPYAYVYERAKPGSFRCAGGELKPLAGFELSDAAIFQQVFGLNKEESDCSIILDAK